jgi:hypothetical protein
MRTIGRDFAMALAILGIVMAILHFAREADRICVRESIGQAMPIGDRC